MPLHTLPSETCVPLATRLFEHAPLPLHVSAASHSALCGVETPHATVLLALVPGATTPSWHVSMPLHTLPSLTCVPFVTRLFEHAPLPLHMSAASHCALCGVALPHAVVLL